MPATARRSEGLVVALDGPGSSGKSSVGAAAARELGYRFFDTGLLYRAITWLALDRGVGSHDADALVGLVEAIELADDDDGHLTRVLSDGRDVTDATRVNAVFKRFQPEIVFHAAAHKHVPLMELNVCEAVKNNILGSHRVAQAAGYYGVEHCVLISSDKAVDPSSVMGATKRLGELLISSRAGASPARLTAVRFGNVLGSAGSVVPIFKAQIARGGPVTVTHSECRRFLMTIPEAVGLVILTGLSPYGDLCVLEMGEPMRILDLARLMITMAGLVPEKDIQIVFTGLRPGEKLDERLMTKEEERTSYVLRDTIRVVKTPPPSGDLDAQIDRLAELARAGDRPGLLAALREIVPTYRPADPAASEIDPLVVART
jgi:FlaA1/EpsC-like NDP-sugar epimerase